MMVVRVLAVVVVMCAALSAAAQRMEIPAVPVPAVPAVPMIVLPPPPPPAPLGSDLHIHVPQQCCRNVCMADAACQAGNACPQRCTNVCGPC